MQKQKLLISIIGFILNVLSLFSRKIAARSAFQLFTTPRKGRILAEQATFLATAEKEMLSTTFGKIQAYLWNQEGEQSILLLHGWESNSARWQNLIKVLIQANYRVIAIDAPAHGDSSNKTIDMVQYAEATSIAVDQYQPDFLAGHSLGGATLTYFWAHYPKNEIKKVVLLASPGGLEEMMLRFQQLLDLHERLLKGLDRLFVEKYAHAIPYFSTINFARSIEVPSLIIHDEEDPVTPIAEGKAIHSSLPNSKLILTKGLGHSLQDEKVYKYVVNFLGEADH